MGRQLGKLQCAIFAGKVRDPGISMLFCAATRNQLRFQIVFQFPSPSCRLNLRPKSAETRTASAWPRATFRGERAVELNFADGDFGAATKARLPAAASLFDAFLLNTWGQCGCSATPSPSPEPASYPDALAPFRTRRRMQEQSHRNLATQCRSPNPTPKTPWVPLDVGVSRILHVHVELARTETQSATTIMMWLFGFSVAITRGHFFFIAYFAYIFHNFCCWMIARQASRRQPLRRLSAVEISKIRPSSGRDFAGR